MIRSTTTAGRARNGLIALLGALLTFAAAGSEAGAATYTFTNPYATASSQGSAEAYREAATKGYNLRLDVVARSVDDNLDLDGNDWDPWGTARVGTSLVRGGKSAPKIRATVRVLSLIDTTRSPGVTLGLYAETKRDGLRGCGSVRANGAGTYTLECTATNITAGSSLSAWVGMADTIHDRFPYTGPAGRSSATAIVQSVTLTT